MLWLSLTANVLLGLLFAKAYGESTSTWNAPYSVIQTTDSGYALAGYTEASGGYDVIVIKLNSSGVIQWAKAYGGTRNDVARVIIQTSDGGYAVGGTSNSFGSGSSDSDFFLLKLSSGGSIQWAKAYHYDNADSLYALIQTSDGGYALAGNTYLSTTSNEFYVIKTASDGSVQWNYTHGFSAGSETARAIAQLSDGSYVISGNSISDYQGVLIVKASSDGSRQWYKKYANADTAYKAYSMAVALTGDYMLGGISINPGAGGATDFFALMLNPDGSVDWTKRIAGTQYDTAFSVFRASDGGYVFAGTTNSYGAGALDFMVVKLSANGNFQWAKTFGKAATNDIAYSVTQMKDGTFAIAGATPGYGAGGLDPFILKLSSTGVYVGCVETCTPTVATPSLSQFLGGFASSPVHNALLRNASFSVYELSLSAHDACPPSETEEGLSGPADKILCASAPGGLVFSSGTAALLRLYYPDGRLARSLSLEKGENRISLEAGAYIWIAEDCRGKAVVR